MEPIQNLHVIRPPLDNPSSKMGSYSIPIAVAVPVASARPAALDVDCCYPPGNNNPGDDDSLKSSTAADTETGQVLVEENHLDANIKRQRVLRALVVFLAIVLVILLAVLGVGLFLKQRSNEGALSVNERAIEPLDLPSTTFDYPHDSEFPDSSLETQSPTIRGRP